MDELDYINDPEAVNKCEELKAMDISCDAVIILGERYHKLALEMAEKETDETERLNFFRLLQTWKSFRHTNRRPTGRQSSCTGLHTLQ